MLYRRSAILLLSIITLPVVKAQMELPQEESEKNAANMLISHVQAQTAKVFPRRYRRLPPELRYQLKHPKNNENPVFSINRNSYVIQIVLPRNFYQNVMQIKTIFPLIHTCVSARLGQRTPIRDQWITAALLSELFDPGIFQNANGYGNNPYSRTMLAHGIAPDLISLLNSQEDDFSGGAYSAAKLEWCHLLMDLCSSHPVSLEQSIVASQKADPAEKFRRILYPALNSHKKNQTVSLDPESMQKWFLSKLTEKVLGRGIPASVPYIEKEFRTAMEPLRSVIRIPDKKEQKNDSEQNLTNEENQELAAAERRLNRLGLIAPEQIALKLFSCAKALREFRFLPTSKQNVQAVLQEESEVYRSLTVRAALEQTLQNAEQRLIPPGTRFALTLQAVTPVKPELPLLKKAHSLLDHFEKDY